MEDGVGWIRLNRPRQLNAIDARLRAALGQAVKQGARDEAARVLVITGEGPAFCAGADVNEFADIQGLGALPDEYGSLLTRVAHDAQARHRRRERPRSRHRGRATRSACDIRIATPGGVLLEAFVNIGLTADGGAAGCCHASPAPPSRTRSSSREAAGRPRSRTLGLLNRVVAPDRLEAAVRELAGQLARRPRRPWRR